MSKKKDKVVEEVKQEQVQQVPGLPPGPKLSLHYVKGDNTLQKFEQMGRWNWKQEGDMVSMEDGTVEIVIPAGRIVNFVIER